MSLLAEARAKKQAQEANPGKPGGLLAEARARNGGTQNSRTIPNNIDLESFNPADFDTGGNYQAQPPQPEQPGALKQGANLALEGVSAAQRAAFAIPDMVPKAVNEVAGLIGSEFRAPTLQGTLGEEKGAFAGEGLATDIAAGAGEGVMMGLGVAGVLNRLTQALPDVPASTLQRVMKEIGKFMPTTEAVAGAGGGAGAVVGEKEGGTTGAIIGGLAGGLGAVGLAQGAKSVATTAAGATKPVIDAIRTRLGRGASGLIDDAGLPVPAFQKALEKNGLTFGSIVDDVDNLPALRPGQSMNDYANQIAVRKLNQGTSDAGLADKMVKPSKTGRTLELATDDLAVDTIKNGWGRGYIGNVKNSNDNTRNAMGEMLNIKRKVMIDNGIPDRPLDVAGDELFKQIQFVRNQTNRLRGELEVASKELKGKRLNTAPVEAHVFKMLDDLNMNIPNEIMSDSRQLRAFLASDEPFKSTAISPDESAKNLIRKAVDLMSEASDDAFNGHILKKQLDSLIDYNRADSKLTPKGEQFATGLRRAVNESVRNISTKYAQVNDDISTALDTIKSVTEPLSKSAKESFYSASEGDSTYEALGQEIRKLETNYPTRPALEDALQKVSETSERFGAKFDVDLRRLANFNNGLDDRFGSTAKGSQAGQQEIGTKAAIRSLNRPMEVLKDQIAEKALKLLTPTDEDALNSMQRLLKRKK